VAGAAAACCLAACAVAGWRGAASPGAFVVAGLQPARTHQVSTSPRAASIARRAWVTTEIGEPPEDLSSIKQRKFTPSAEHLEYAVVEYSGKQHMVHEGGMYETTFIRALPGSKVRLNRMLLLKRKDESGEFKVTLGKPIIDGAYCEITILEHLKSEEQEIYKHKPKKHYQKRYIVTQLLTRFRIDRIVWDAPDTPIEGRQAYPLLHEDGPQARMLAGDGGSKTPRMYYTRPIPRWQH